MLAPAASESGPTLFAVECGLAAIAIALSFCWPGLGSGFFSRIERLFGKLARRQRLAVMLVGATALLLRLATLPLNPIPQPFVHDDFSFMLAADTFASGHLTNPTPAMWTHFETFHITMKPTYMSMYFPAQGLVMAAAKVMTRQPWFGILVVTALMCAALCWMLQAWLPPVWALLGGIVALLRLGLFSYWINTYTGAGSIAALGGALVLGSLPRLMKHARFRHGLLMAVGIILLASSRPYEGLLLCLPVAFVLCRWMLRDKNAPPAPVLLRRAAIPLLLIVAAMAWMGYYNDRVFGSPLTPPYKIDRATYAVVPYWVWQPLRPAPRYRARMMREFYCENEVSIYASAHSRTHYIPQLLLKAGTVILFFAGITLIFPLIMLPRVFMDRRIRFLILCLLILMAGMSIEIFLIPHYVAPFTVVFYAIGLQCMRHLRQWKPGGVAIGKASVRFLITVCVLLCGIRLYAAPLHLDPPKRLDSGWIVSWYGPREFGAARAAVESHLESLSGKQLVIVRYSRNHNPLDEWVFNAPDVDHAKVVWARDLGAQQNDELTHYYKDRTVWLVQPDKKPVSVTPYYASEPALPQETARLK